MNNRKLKALRSNQTLLDVQLGDKLKDKPNINSSSENTALCHRLRALMMVVSYQPEPLVNCIVISLRGFD